LIFHLDGKDLTTQAIKDTQAIIDENLGVGPQILARTMFHGQFAMNGLLEATDAKLKEELSLVVPLNIWQEGVSIARANSREASKKSSEFEGMVHLRSSDFDDLVKQRDNAEVKRSIQQVAFERTEARIKDEIRQLRESMLGAHDISIDSVQFALDETTSMIQVLESQLKNVEAERDSALAELKAYTNEAEKDVCLKRHEAHSKQREYDVAVMKLESANTSREQIAKKWNIDLVSDAMVDSFLPELCPTCQQPISSTGSGHSHAEMQRIVKEEIDGVVLNLVAAEDSVNEAADAWESASATLAMAETRMKESITNFEQSSFKWTKTIGSVEAALTEARSKQAELSSQLTTVAKAIHQESIIKSKETTLLDARKTLETSQAVYQDLCTLVEDSDSRLRQLRASAEAQRSLSVTMANLVNIFGPRGVQTFLLQNAIESLQTISQVSHATSSK
jgi:chromosome segregation ATPase